MISCTKGFLSFSSPLSLFPPLITPLLYFHLTYISTFTFSSLLSLTFSVSHSPHLTSFYLPSASPTLSSRHPLHPSPSIPPPPSPLSPPPSPWQVSGLVQRRIALVEKLQETLERLTSLQQRVLDQELISWKREQQMAGNGRPFDENRLNTIQEW